MKEELQAEHMPADFALVRGFIRPNELHDFVNPNIGVATIYDSCDDGEDAIEFVMLPAARLEVSMSNDDLLNPQRYLPMVFPHEYDEPFGDVRVEMKPWATGGYVKWQVFEALRAKLLETYSALDMCDRKVRALEERCADHAQSARHSADWATQAIAAKEAAERERDALRKENAQLRKRVRALEEQCAEARRECSTMCLRAP